jgi:uncharacterized protein
MNPYVQIGDAIPGSSVSLVPKPWGFWATIGFSLVVIALLVALQAIVVIGCMVYYSMQYPQTDPIKLAKGLDSNGLFLSLVSWITFPICLGLVILFVKLRPGWTIREYLGLKPVPIRAMLGWLGILLVFVAASDGLTRLLGPVVATDFMDKIYQTAYSVPLLCATLAVAAPVFEEAFFRGFMIPGIQASRLGTAGALVIPAMVWALIHVQYNLYYMTQILVVGLLFGTARIKTGSIYPTLAMHSLMNLIAVIEAGLCQ